MTSTASTNGSVAPGYEHLVPVFERALGAGGAGGAAFAATLRGRPIVDLWGGVADAATGRPWDRDTVAPIFSGTKGLLAVCVLLLVERGRLDLDAPVARYWPE